MVQFKPILSGTVRSSSLMNQYERVVNSQKCLRVGGKDSDLDLVGLDGHHHSFFEMLGNWSFGDYFKLEACVMAWRLLTEVYRIPTNQLYVTYFGGDEKLGLAEDLECKYIWLSLGLPSSRVVAYGMKDNFWFSGLTGPCGSSTEIHYSYKDDEDVSHLINQGSKDVIELWNLVFMTYNRQFDGKLTPLNKCHVDTGMGLERLCTVLQGTNSTYDTDLFAPLLKYLKTVSRINDDEVCSKIISDHIRLITVAVTDGILPSEDFRLAKMIRRLVYLAEHRLKIESNNYIEQLIRIVAESLGSHYVEISENLSKTIEIVKDSHQVAATQIKQGRKLLEEKIERKLSNSHTEIKGEEMWVWYRDGGLSIPFELLEDLSSQYNFNLNIWFLKEKIKETQVSSYSAFEERQKLISQRATRSSNIFNMLKSQNVSPTDTKLVYSIATWDEHTHSYMCEPVTSTILSIIPTIFQTHSLETVQSIDVNTGPAAIVTKETGFYHKAGGQLSDTGLITTLSGSFQVDDVERCGDYVLHYGKLLGGQMKCEERCQQQIHSVRRSQLTSNHTATHLLNAALWRIHGGKVKQKESEVGDDSLSLTYSLLDHRGKILTSSGVDEVMRLVNQWIDESLPVSVIDMGYRDAINLHGVRYLTGHDYPDVVRVVKVGDECSVELCCGCHVHNTSHIKKFAIRSCKPVSPLTQRIVAVTGDCAKQMHKSTDEVTELLALAKKMNFKTWPAISSQIQERISRHGIVASRSRDIRNIVSKYEFNHRVLQSGQERDKKSVLGELIVDLMRDAQHEVTPYIITSIDTYHFKPSVAQMKNAIKMSAKNQMNLTNNTVKPCFFLSHRTDHNDEVSIFAATYMPKTYDILARNWMSEIVDSEWVSNEKYRHNEYCIVTGKLSSLTDPQMYIQEVLQKAEQSINALISNFSLPTTQNLPSAKNNAQ